MTLHPDDLRTPSWVCVHFVDAASWKPVEGLNVATIDAARITSADDLFGAIASAWRFPASFGVNWDALADCLRDLEWEQSSGFALVVKNGRNLWCTNPIVAGQLVTVWLVAAEAWAGEGKPFHLVWVL